MLLLLNFNTLLSNKLNIIHPLCLYFGTSYVLIYFYINTTRNQLYYKHLSCLNLHTVCSSYLILLFTIILGGWWAEQEGTWGG